MTEKLEKNMTALFVALLLTVEVVNGALIDPPANSVSHVLITGHGFSFMTETIVMSHMEDFNYESFDSFMESKGGAEAYVSSLGGVFTKWCGVQGNVQTASEFREAAEYVLGVMTIWGPDYHGGSGDIPFNAEADEYGRFYEGQELDRSWKLGPIEEVYFQDRDRIVTDCGCGTFYILQKAGLVEKEKYAGTTYSSTGWNKVDTGRGGKIIRDVKDLQAGDLIQMSKTDDESGWGHVALVAEVKDDGTVITYETGSRFVKTGCCKCVFEVDQEENPINEYEEYESWFGMRMRELIQD